MGVFTRGQNGSSVRLGNQQALRKVQEMVCLVGCVSCLNFLMSRGQLEAVIIFQLKHATARVSSSWDGFCREGDTMHCYLPRRCGVEVGSSGLRLPLCYTACWEKERESLNTRESSESREVIDFTEELTRLCSRCSRRTVSLAALSPHSPSPGFTNNG